jgi:Spy/CpxP family protein refolding chaperone
MIIATPLTPEQRAALEANLADARAAYHQLAIGGQARVIVDQNGERV